MNTFFYLPFLKKFLTIVFAVFILFPHSRPERAEVCGIISFTYTDSIPEGGVALLDNFKTTVEKDGSFYFDNIPVNRYNFLFYYNSGLILKNEIILQKGFNETLVNIDTIIPAFMVRNITHETSELEIFKPVQKKVFCSGNPELKRIAITIDDGWFRDDRFLNLFKKYNVRCTVFIIGGRGIGNKNPDWLRKMDEMGFEICNHTYNHYRMTELSDNDLIEDLRKSQMVITNVTNKLYPYLRPPFGVYDERTLKVAAENGYYIILWSNSIDDTVEGIKLKDQVKNVMGNLKNGDIILAHFSAYNTYEVLEIIIPEILKQGYKLVTVSEVLEGLLFTEHKNPQSWP